MNQPDESVNPDKSVRIQSTGSTAKHLDRKVLARLPASHLYRHFLLIAVLTLFLLTLARAGYMLWQLVRYDETATMLSSFVTGFRFDLAMLGIVLALPVFVVPLLAMFRPILPIARFLSLAWMLLVFLAIVLLELVTPYTLQESGLRPDVSVLTELGNPVDVLAKLWTSYIIPAVIGVFLATLIYAAFWARLDMPRFLRHPIKAIPAICLSIIGLALCLFAATSSINPTESVLTPHASLISADSVVNEIAGNSLYKTLYGLLVR